MDAVINQMQNLEISNEFLSGKDLTIQKELLQSLNTFTISFQNEISEQKIDLAYYVGKYCISVTFR